MNLDNPDIDDAAAFYRHPNTVEINGVKRNVTYVADVYAALFDHTPLSLDVLRRELGDPRKRRELDPGDLETWQVSRLVYVEFMGKLGAAHVYCGSDHVDGLKTLGQLRRILSVFRETAAGGEG